MVAWPIFSRSSDYHEPLRNLGYDEHIAGCNSYGHFILLVELAQLRGELLDLHLHSAAGGSIHLDASSVKHWLLAMHQIICHTPQWQCWSTGALCGSIPCLPSDDRAPLSHWGAEVD